MPRTRKANPTGPAPAGQAGHPTAPAAAAEAMSPPDDPQAGKTTSRGRRPRKPAAEEKTAGPRSRRRAAPPAAAPEADALGDRLRALSLQMEDLACQAATVGDELQALRRQREQWARELEELHRQAHTAEQQFLHLSVEVSERVRGEAQALETQAGEMTQLFAQAREFLQTLPRQADEVRQRLDEVQHRLPRTERELAEVEQSSEAARQELAAIKEESRQARQRLDAILGETAAIELRLAAARQEFHEAEQRLRLAQQKIDEAARQAHQAQEQAEEARQEARAVAVVEEVVTPPPAPPEGRNRLGVTVEPGVVVAEVLPGTSAAAAGLIEGDIISSVNDTPVFSGPDLRNSIQALPAGEEVVVHARRAGQPIEVRARLGETAASETSAEGRNRLGVTVAPGVVVADVLPGTPAEAAGLRPGDVISSVNGVEVATSEQLRQAVVALPVHAEVNLQVHRARQVREVRARLDGQS